MATATQPKPSSSTEKKTGKKAEPKSGSSTFPFIAFMPLLGLLPLVANNQNKNKKDNSGMPGVEREDPFVRWASDPYFDFLEPQPWSVVKPYVFATLGVFAIGFGLAEAAYERGYKGLLRPARYTWTLAIGLMLYTGWLWLPRVGKFGIMVFGGGIFGTLFLIVSTVWVYGGMEPNKEKEKKDKDAKDAAVEKGDENGEGEEQGVEGKSDETEVTASL